ncbi:hypothetical protein CHRY9390_00812 [Chryseobacterium aquaeductus]|uniref:Uncharacterized protein n=2 Tax=Chryseobacterium aquaeductus TaxID=2675056 RepID=A0A9N8MM12_9FLAO|nr:hypothetical protein CHRY9390_00812 [Chryseobacterium potabilaquae]CAD7801678.1 hypothetical protein CHRY9390_00812 [Chryseobacterium aquaeductus]
MVLILLTKTSFHDIATELVDKIVISIILLNLVVFTFIFKNKMLIYISILLFVYIIFTISYNEEMDSYFYRIGRFFGVGKLENETISKFLQSYSFICFFASLLLEIIFLIKTVYRKTVKKD